MHRLAAAPIARGACAAATRGAAAARADSHIRLAARLGNPTGLR